MFMNLFHLDVARVYLFFTKASYEFEAAKRTIGFSLGQR
jgi:hypothetical protein